jgi:glycosyltransferase involved in cell wall biosynthesis
VAVVDKVLGMARRIWRGAMPASARAAFQPVAAGLLARRAFAAASPLEPAFAPGPLVVSGFLSESKGISQAARLTVAALAEAGFAPVAHDIRNVLARGPGGGARLPASEPGGVWLAHCNAPEAVAALAMMAPESWRGRYRIGYWAYELPMAPPSWVRASRLFHEIWAPSRFVAEALRSAGVTTRIEVMPHPVAAENLSPHPNRAQFGLPADAFCVLAMGDLLSSATRKNLAGAVDIYRKAFPTPGEGRRLAVKAMGGAAHPDFIDYANRIARERPDIVFITENLPGPDVRSLLASCDVLLSPHRAEGFGLPLAEAFLMGVPPLATGWSGNVDFMADLDDLLIAYTMTPVRDPDGVYPAGRLSWAEPDVDDAVRKLLALAASPDLRRSLARRGRLAVEALSDPWSRDRLQPTALGQLVKR